VIKVVDATRAHGVTPGLSREYSQRTSDRQAAFLIPYLNPGMALLDLGCGPGSITVGLAQSVHPGHVVGVDHDAAHLETAAASAAKLEVSNIGFQKADALSLPFEDGAFDVAFENNMLVHIPEQAIDAAREIYRVVKDGGMFAARDAAASSAVWGQRTEEIIAIDRLMHKWQILRGSDIDLGLRLPTIVGMAGFERTVKSVSADTKGDPQSIKSHAALTVGLLDGPLGRAALDNGWADEHGLDRMKDGIRTWADHPDAFFANLHVEVIGWKTG
jgi:SAM-dependent methyltransferase